MLRCCGLDFSADRRDNAKTEHSADIPDRGRTARPSAGDVSRYDALDDAVGLLADILCETDFERALLRDVLDHIAEGGIVISHGGDLVFTWTDGGVSRRAEARARGLTQGLR